MVRLVDTHCHLDFNRFDPDRTEVLNRARVAGVERIVVPAVDLSSNARVVKLAAAYDFVYAAVGIHPNDITPDLQVEETLRTLHDRVKTKRVVAVGEIGLDYYWKKASPDLQQEWLRRQLDLAATAKFPVIIHNRESTKDVIAVLREWTSQGLPPELDNRRGVLHSFSADWSAAEQLLDMGFYVGFTGTVTYKKADEVREVAARTPLDRIVIETDAPFLAPHPHRGERNEPAYVCHVAAAIAGLRDMDIDAFAAQTTTNAAQLFQFGLAASES